MNLLTTKKAAAILGLTPDAVRYHERQGQIPPSRWTVVGVILCGSSSRKILSGFSDSGPPCIRRSRAERTMARRSNALAVGDHQGVNHFRYCVQQYRQQTRLHR